MFASTCAVWTQERSRYGSSNWGQRGGFPNPSKGATIYYSLKDEEKNEIKRRVGSSKERDLLGYVVFKNDEVLRGKHWWRTVGRKAKDADFQIHEVGVDANGFDVVLRRCDAA